MSPLLGRTRFYVRRKSDESEYTASDDEAGQAALHDGNRHQFFIFRDTVHQLGPSQVRSEAWAEWRAAKSRQRLQQAPAMGDGGAAGDSDGDWAADVDVGGGGDSQWQQPRQPPSRRQRARRGPLLGPQ